MKAAKIFAAMLLAALMVFTAAACSGSNTGTSSANSGTGSEAAADAVAAIQARGSITMVTNAEFEPFEFKDGDSIVGIDAEIAQKIADKLGVKLEITDIAFDSVVPSVQSGKADFGAAGMTITPDRIKNVDFTDPYFTTTQAIIVAVDSEITGRADLNDKIVGVQTGTTGDEYCTNEDGSGDIHVAEVKRYNKGLDAVSDLATGRVDAVVIDKNTAKALVSKNSDKVKLLDEAMTQEEYAISVAKGSNLTAAINEVLAEMKANGELNAIFEKYGADNDAE